MKEQQKSSDGEIEVEVEGSQELQTSASPTKKQEDPAEPRFVDWPKE